MSSDLGQKIREIREAEELGRQAFSELTDIPKQTLINIELGKSAPSGKHLALVSQVFTRYTLWLMTGQTNEKCGQISPLDEELKGLYMKGEKIEKYSLIRVKDILKRNLEDRGLTSKEMAKNIGLKEEDVVGYFNDFDNVVKDKEIELKLYVYLFHKDVMEKSLLNRISSVSYKDPGRLPG